MEQWMTLRGSPAGEPTDEVFDRITDAVFALDDEWRFTFLNEHAEGLLESDEAALLGENVWDVFPAAAESTFRDEYERARETGESVSFEAYYDPLSTWFSVRAYPSETGLSVYFRDVSGRKRRDRALREAYEIASDADRSFDERVGELLALVRGTLDLAEGVLSRVDGDTYTPEAVSSADGDGPAVGESVPLDETLCARVLAADGAMTVADAADGPTAYVGTPVYADGEQYGTFCFYGGAPRPDGFSEWEVTFVELLGNWVSSELQRRRTIDRLTALDEVNAVVRDINGTLVEQSTRADIERVVCERLAASDSYEFAWLGVVDEHSGEVVPSTAVRADEYLADVTVSAAPDEDRGRGPAGRALRTGEVHISRDIETDADFAPWRDHARERGVRSAAAVPVGTDGAEYGVLNLYSTRRDAFGEQERAVVAQLGEITGLAIAAVEHEREVEHKRERLEFINRFLRHNLLNGLNLVTVRSDLLARSVDDPDAADHVEVIRERVDDMAGLIDTMRTFMDAVIEGSATAASRSPSARCSTGSSRSRARATPRRRSAPATSPTPGRACSRTSSSARC
ncbi:GAF domain-containing protein [Halosegnis marinus]|uniref:GAF domain-containing protein n=1 Tax=Halosegnis marinus TaxID=3034023 RepID=UPI003616A569